MNHISKTILDKYFKNEENFVRFMLILLNELNILHHHKIIHRDIKPTNIMLFEENEKLFSIFIDFGVSFFENETTFSIVPDRDHHPKNDSVVTRAYDVYSLGKIFENLHIFILKSKKIKFLLSDDLISIIHSMVEENYTKRPSTNHVISNLLVYCSQKNYSFDVLDFLLKTSKETTKETLFYQQKKKDDEKKISVLRAFEKKEKTEKKEEKKVEKREKDNNEDPIFGISNISNNCFLNCSLQLLLSIDLLSSFFRNIQILERNGKKEFIFQLQKIFLNKNKIFDPSQLLHSFFSEFPSLTRGAQHDAGETILLILNFVLEIDNFSFLKKILKHKTSTKHSCSGCKKESNPKIDKSFILALSLSENLIQNDQFDLNQVLDSFTSRNQLEERWDCKRDASSDNSNECLGETFEEITITSFPQYFLVQLKQYKSLEKIESTPLFDINNFSFNGMKYTLLAAICHTGKLESGHYYCYVLKKNKQWYCSSDVEYKKVDKPNLKFAYILLFKKCF